MSGARRREEPPHAQQHALANGGGAGPRGSVWSKALRSDSAWHDKVRDSAGPAGGVGRLRGSAAGTAVPRPPELRFRAVGVGGPGRVAVGEPLRSVGRWRRGLGAGPRLKPLSDD